MLELYNISDMLLTSINPYNPFDFDNQCNMGKYGNFKYVLCTTFVHRFSMSPVDSVS